MRLKMSQDLSVLVSINEELGDNFDNLTAKCKKYRDVLLKRQYDITENVSTLYFGIYARS